MEICSRNWEQAFQVVKPDRVSLIGDSGWETTESGNTTPLNSMGKKDHLKCNNFWVLTAQF